MTVLPRRKKNRLQDYNYSQNGAYFITICTKDRKKIFGDIVGAAICRPHIKLSTIGESIANTIENISKIYQCVTVDKYVVMPNHVHMIIVINDNGRQVAAPTVNTIVGNMKRHVSMQAGFSLWQKSFHDHIIRDEANYLKIAEYIENTPITWNDDCFYV